MSRKRSQIKRVHIEGEAWSYQVGTSTVSIRDPKGKRVLVDRSKIVRGHPHNVQHTLYDDNYLETFSTFTYPTPSLVKNYIWRKLRPGKLISDVTNQDQAKDSILKFFFGDAKEQPEQVFFKGRARAC